MVFHLFALFFTFVDEMYLASGANLQHTHTIRYTRSPQRETERESKSSSSRSHPKKRFNNALQGGGVAYAGFFAIAVAVARRVFCCLSACAFSRAFSYLARTHAATGAAFRTREAINCYAQGRTDSDGSGSGNVGAANKIKFQKQQAAAVAAATALLYTHLRLVTAKRRIAAFINFFCFFHFCVCVCVVGFFAFLFFFCYFFFWQ